MSFLPQYLPLIILLTLSNTKKNVTQPKYNKFEDQVSYCLSPKPALEIKIGLRNYNNKLVFTLFLNINLWKWLGHFVTFKMNISYLFEKIFKDLVFYTNFSQFWNMKTSKFKFQYFISVNCEVNSFNRRFFEDPFEDTLHFHFSCNDIS